MFLRTGCSSSLFGRFPIHLSLNQVVTEPFTKETMQPFVAAAEQATTSEFNYVQYFLAIGLMSAVAGQTNSRQFDGVFNA